MKRGNQQEHDTGLQLMRIGKQVTCWYVQSPTRWLLSPEILCRSLHHQTQASSVCGGACYRQARWQLYSVHELYYDHFFQPAKYAINLW